MKKRTLEQIDAAATSLLGGTAMKVTPTCAVLCPDMERACAIADEADRPFHGAATSYQNVVRVVEAMLRMGYSISPPPAAPALCQKRESGGVQCEKEYEHEDECACPKAIERFLAASRFPHLLSQG